jgi:transposase-like protein
MRSVMDRDSLTLLLAQGVSVEQMARRFGKDPSTISYWMQKFGLEAPTETGTWPRAGSRGHGCKSSSTPG